MSGEALVMASATAVVVIFYYIIKALFSAVKNATSRTNHIEEPQVIKRLDIRNKQSIIDGIDYYIDSGEYEAALKLCNIFDNENGKDEDIERRKKYLKNRI